MLFQPELIDWIEFKKQQRSHLLELSRGRPKLDSILKKKKLNDIAQLIEQGTKRDELRQLIEFDNNDYTKAMILVKERELAI